MADMNKAGIAGLGRIGRRHLAQYRALGIAACTADPQVSPDEALYLGAAAHYGSFEELMERERPRVASICLPSHLHRAGALTALSRGADVLVEKPLALSLCEIDEMLAAARAHGRRVMPGHLCRFMGQYRLAMEVADSGELGKPVFLTAWRICAAPRWSAGNWIGDARLSGGTVFDLQIHDIDIACRLLGKVEHSSLLTRRAGESGAASGFCHALSSLTFEGGAAALLEASHLLPQGYPSTNGFRLVLEGGAVEFGQTAGGAALLRLFRPGKAEDRTAECLSGNAGSNPLLDEIGHFVRCVETGEPFNVTAEEGRAAVQAALRLLESEP